MSYETAPATLLVATHCAVCARSLVDAKSVELGIGPDCARKHGFGIECSPEARAEANRLVYAIAADQDGPGVVDAINRLRDLGFGKLADRIADRVAVVSIEVSGERIVVTAPYSEASVEAFRRVPGRRWDAEAKANMFPIEAKPQLWRALQYAFPGATGRTADGFFTIPGRRAA